jgi:mannitol-specific phosphotransferase system IIBC component
MDSELLGVIVGALVTFTLALIKYKSDKKKIDLEIENLQLENRKLKNENNDVKVKLQFLDRVLDLPFINDLSNAVDKIFEETKADRFLVLIAKNGKEDFNIVNVVFEQHKDKNYRINAIARYRNVHIDHPYKQMLKETEFRGVVELETATMPRCILKSFYENEGITHSKVRHLARKPIDNDNDFLVYSSLSTHDKDKFTPNELAMIKTQYEGTIMPALQKVID